MFEGLERKKAAIPRRVAVWAAVTGSFGVGLGADKLITGARPFDWTLEILDLTFVLGFTIWLSVAATRNDKTGE